MKWITRIGKIDEFEELNLYNFEMKEKCKFDGIK